MNCPCLYSSKLNKGVTSSCCSEAVYSCLKGYYNVCSHSFTVKCSASLGFSTRAAMWHMRTIDGHLIMWSRSKKLLVNFALSTNIKTGKNDIWQICGGLVKSKYGTLCGGEDCSKGHHTCYIIVLYINILTLVLKHFFIKVINFRLTTVSIKMAFKINFRVVLAGILVHTEYQLWYTSTYVQDMAKRILLLFQMGPFSLLHWQKA